MEEDQMLAWKPLQVEHVVRDQWIDFRRIRYELPDGSVYEPFYSYSRRSYVVIVASDEEGRFLCVRQYRPG
ncbi:MAG: NUDIX hydrolase, partial [Oribacterium sp.]|nr:NUDIX hydrolase [Oribacterium sp.]